MKIKQVVLMGVVAMMVSGLTGCGGCTQEEAMQKSLEVASRIQSLGSKDMGKLMELSKKMDQIGKDLANADDPSEACEALDEMLAELD